MYEGNPSGGGSVCPSVICFLSKVSQGRKSHPAPKTLASTKRLKYSFSRWYLETLDANENGHLMFVKYCLASRLVIDYEFLKNHLLRGHSLDRTEQEEWARWSHDAIMGSMLLKYFFYVKRHCLLTFFQFYFKQTCLKDDEIRLESMN